ncbi:glycosyltransferase family 2 protein [Flavobacterium sp. HJJ]|uniref:glycosyltransferase family 2 protein n=1 Tax=Flavobacterium sp. HJJ TaxID=2783792 RepID=UPI00188C7891|nr:glycosyltransferase family 2 protein [Flavobacterium sp. HJJ]MBF4470298.1 glycosyltransferase [Flavobacterium sp. HJJ]
MQKLSIITINYNNLEGLKRTIESVVNQTWKKFEYIIIDGGSTDGSAEYLEKHKDNFDYCVSEKDLGIYNAMNKGIKKSTGDYLLFLNSGDHLYDEIVLENSNSYLDQYDLVCFDMQVIGEKESRIFSMSDKLRFSDLYFESLPHPATFIKKQLFDIVGFYDENLKIVSDWKFFILALYKHNCSYMKINQLISTFYLDGISSYTNYYPERNQVLQDYFGGFVLDYKELQNHRKILKTNRIKMLFEIEKTTIGKKIVSIFFRIYISLFSKKKLKDIID